MIHTIRRFLLLEAAAFLAASLVHAGVLFDGYAHAEARTAETILALALLAGLAWSWARPEQTARAGAVAQGFALLGTAVGVSTIAIGIGPRTGPDVVYHLVIAAVLAWGLAIALRAGRRARARPGDLGPGGAIRHAQR